jgi:hypothetical protein
MRILVTSAGGANGNGYGAILGFGPEGEFTGRSAAIRGSPIREGSSLTRQAHASTSTAATTACWRSI